MFRRINPYSTTSGALGVWGIAPVFTTRSHPQFAGGNVSVYIPNLLQTRKALVRQWLVTFSSRTVWARLQHALHEEERYQSISVTSEGGVRGTRRRKPGNSMDDPCRWTVKSRYISLRARGHVGWASVTGRLPYVLVGCEKAALRAMVSALGTPSPAFLHSYTPTYTTVLCVLTTT